MTNIEAAFYKRFAVFHEKLNEVCLIADGFWAEGGMSWRAEFVHRGAHSALVDAKQYGFSKIHGESIQNAEQLKDFVFPWAVLLWSAYGQNLVDGALVAPSPNRVRDHFSDAHEIIQLFAPKNRNEKCFMHFQGEEISISAKAIFISDNHAFIHSIFWSVD